MAERHYRILGLNSNATLEDIKNAYRKRAKMLHPDVNKSENAHENFILLNEAYEYLQNVKTGKVYSNNKHAYSHNHKYRNYEEWKASEREESIKRARQYAKMKYEKFTQTSFYKTSVALNVIADHLMIFSAIAFILGLPVLTLAYGSFIGVFISFFIVLISLPFWKYLFKKGENKINLSELWNALQQVFKTRTFRTVAALGINIFLFAKVTLNTLIPFSDLLLIYCIAFTTAFFYNRINVRFNAIKKRLILTGLAPGIVNLYFLINFLFSSNPVVETYAFEHWTITENNRESKTNFIFLDKNAYADYAGIRVFLNFEEMKYADSIRYTFEDGLFGLKVAKDHEFLE